MILTLIVAGVIFVLAQLCLAYFIWQHRERSGRQATYSRGNNKLEITWTVATAVFFIALGIMAQDIWAKIYYTEAPPGALQIQVVGKAVCLELPLCRAGRKIRGHAPQAGG